jgi:PAS domain S-box-containing protein
MPLNMILLVLNMWVVSGVVLALHYYRNRVGFVPFLFLIAGMTIIVQSQWGVYIEPIPQIFVFYSSGALVPIILMSVLVLYVVEGAVETRITIWSIIGITLFFLGAQIFVRWIAFLPGGGSLFGPLLNDLVPPLNARVTVASLSAFLADMFVIAVFYQGLINYSPRIPEWLVIGLSLLAALWTDAIVFSLIADFGTPAFFSLLPGFLVSKTISALILWPPAALYLVLLAPRLPGFLGSNNRRVFDVVFGNIQKVKQELTEAETALTNLEAERLREAFLFKQISDNISEALWLAEPAEGNIIYINTTAEKIWGIKWPSPAQAIMNAIHPDDRESVLTDLPTRFREGGEIEYRILRPDGTTRWVRDRAFPIRNSQGEIYQIAGIAEDITEQKQTSDAIQKLNEQLEKRVADRTFELEQANRELEAFIYSVSHDLRAPVRAISGYSEILLQDFSEALTPDGKRFQQLVLSNAKKLGQLLDDLLVFSRYGRQPISKIQVHPEEIVGEVINELTFDRNNQNIEFVVRALRPCQADLPLLRQVFVNLLENAIKFSNGQEKPRIEVGFQETDQKIVYFVKDNGVGFDMTYANKLFRVFSRLHSENDFQGTGVGLSIVQRIIHRHGGEVWAEAEVDKGATFYFSLPAL